MNEADIKFPCPRCLADPGQLCFFGNGPSETVHLARRVTRLCSEKAKDPSETAALVQKALALDESADLK